MIKIAVFVGSLQKNSYNKMLAKNLERVAPQGVKFQMIDINLPLFNQDLEASYPVHVQKQKDIVADADGLLFVTPEYNRSLPGGLKNAMDWISRPHGANAFAHKPAGVVGAGMNRVSGAIAQSDFRHIAAYLDMKVMGQPEIHIAQAEKHFNKSGRIDSDSESRIKEYMTAFVKWVENEKS